ncbi:MAG: hypothetical protein ACJAQT_002682 [Akkermansiaceae bacterium]|jgi:hypothetical protein
MLLSADVGNSREKQERDPTGAEPECFDQPVRRSLGEGVSPTWLPKEIPLDDGRTLVLDDS